MKVPKRNWKHIKYSLIVASAVYNPLMVCNYGWTPDSLSVRPSRLTTALILKDYFLLYRHCESGLLLYFQTVCCCLYLWILLRCWLCMKGTSPIHVVNSYSSFKIQFTFPLVSFSWQFLLPLPLYREIFFFLYSLNTLYTCHIRLGWETVCCFREGTVYLKSSKSNGTR